MSTPNLSASARARRSRATARPRQSLPEIRTASDGGQLPIPKGFRAGRLRVPWELGVGRSLVSASHRPTSPVTAAAGEARGVPLAGTSRGLTRICADRATRASAPICGRRAVVPARCAGVNGNPGQAQAGGERQAGLCLSRFPFTTRRLAAGVHDRWRSAHIRVSCSSPRGSPVTAPRGTMRLSARLTL